MMRKILIVTNNDDAHARTVHECLIRKGAFPIRWFTEEFLFNQRTIQRISLEREELILDNGEISVDLLGIEVVWHRRPSMPRLLKRIDPLDCEFVEDENRFHMRSLWLRLKEVARWINPYSSFEKSNSKPIQLREAVRLGLAIPNTLITNDQDSILEFMKENEDKEIVYKTFFPVSWKEKEESFGLYTTPISRNQIPDEATLALTPGIYQIKIEKQFEARVTFFGAEHVAVKIHNSEEIDWRKVQKSLKLSPITLPNSIEKKCIDLMNKLEIVFGCFDFIVTPSEEWVFLEVNEMGQFLWIEQALPELHLLDKFCEFLLSDTSVTKQSNGHIDQIELNEIIELPSYQELTNKDSYRKELFKQAALF